METLTLNPIEIDRLGTLQRVLDGYLTQVQAAERLGISDRHVRRLLVRQSAGGAAALASKRRGVPPNNRLSNLVREKILALRRERYQDFGPSLFAEYLANDHAIHISREWLRQFLHETGCWKAKVRKRAIHLPRDRRPRFGELSQIDGSPHDWFEGRAPRCTLLVDIDDASSSICAARFEPTETTNGYFRLVREHLERFGRPRTFYSDKHSIFYDSKRTAHRDRPTQFHRALNDLDVELICANSPQAKGRVERVNATLQDRLTKAMRLAGVSSIDEGNAFLPAFLTAHNARFSVAASNTNDAHRTVTNAHLDEALCKHEERVVTKNATIQIADVIYTLADAYSKRNVPTGARVQIRIDPNGQITALHANHVLELVACGTYLRNAPVIESKDLNDFLDQPRSNPKYGHTPAANHPWRRYVHRPALAR